MEKRQTKKQIILIISLVMLIIAGMATIVKAEGDETDGKVVTSEDKAEIFLEYNEFVYDKLNRQEHPTWLFKDYEISLWCNEHGKDVNGYLTGQEKHYWAEIPEEDKKEGGATAYDPSNPYHWYRRSETEGLVENLVSGSGITIGNAGGDGQDKTVGILGEIDESSHNVIYDPESGTTKHIYAIKNNGMNGSKLIIEEMPYFDGTGQTKYKTDIKISTGEPDNKEVIIDTIYDSKPFQISNTRKSRSTSSISSGGIKYKEVAYKQWETLMKSTVPWCHGTAIHVDPFKYEDGIWKKEGIILTNSTTMPAPEGADWGVDPIKSIEWNKIAEFPVNEVQDGLFILTQQIIYEHPGDIPYEVENLTEEQKNNAYFTADEKQAALWTLKGTGHGHFNATGNNNDKEDRNLGLAAKRYQRYYEMIHDGIGGQDKYEEFIKAMWLDENNNIQELDDKHVTQIEDTVIDGESYKTYAYADSMSQVNTVNKSHILGPFVIDYTVLDEEQDETYKCLDTTDIKGTGASTDYGEEDVNNGQPPEPVLPPEDNIPGQPTIKPAEDENVSAQIKFDAVEKITIYNQDLKNIEDLGGSFKIAYACKDGEIVDEGLERRIIDYDGKRYYEFANGEKVPSFLSKKPFYIVVFRGNMKDEEFTDFYAKVDFQYLESCEGTITEYEGKVWRYWYDVTVKPYTYTYNATGLKTTTNDPYHQHAVGKESISWAPNTYTWELKKEPTGEYAQSHIGFLHTNFKRNYKKTSIVITSWNIEPPPPHIELLKNCTECGPLYGAEFNVKINVKGKDFIFAKDINESFEFSAMTNTQGKIIIDSSYFEQYGIYLGHLENGMITVTFEETRCSSKP